MQSKKKQLTQFPGPGSATVPVAVARVPRGTPFGAEVARRNAVRNGRRLRRGFGGQEDQDRNCVGLDRCGRRDADRCDRDGRAPLARKFVESVMDWSRAARNSRDL